MFKDMICSTLLVAGFLLATHSSDNASESSDTQAVVAVVDYGHILFELTEITAYRQNADGILVPSNDLTEDEIETLTNTTENIKTAIAEIRSKYNFSMVIRQNADPSRMEIPIGSGKWKPDSKDPIRVMTKEERRIKQRNNLFLDLEQRIVSRGSIDITKMVIETLNSKNNQRR